MYKLTWIHNISGWILETWKLEQKITRKAKEEKQWVEVTNIDKKKIPESVATVILSYKGKN